MLSSEIHSSADLVLFRKTSGTISGADDLRLQRRPRHRPRQISASHGSGQMKRLRQLQRHCHQHNRFALHYRHQHARNYVGSVAAAPILVAATRRLPNHKHVLNLNLKETHLIFIDLIWVVHAITSSTLLPSTTGALGLSVIVTICFCRVLQLICFHFNDLQIMTGKILW